MKILQSRLESLQGNTLLLTIVVTGLVGFLLAAYMGLVRSQNISTMRSQSWNAAIPVVEAGLEDALTHINIQLTNDLNVNGWTKQGEIYVSPRRYLSSNYYIATVSNWVVGSPTNRPVIESRGYVSAPIVVASANGPLLATLGNPSLATRKYVARGIRCVTTTDALFSKGLVAKGMIDLKGNNIMSDSYDSRYTNSSTDGRYDVTKRKAGGSVATNSGLTNSLNVGNALIYGKISTGPGGSIAIGPQGAVGDAAFVEEPSNNGKIETGYFTDDMNVDFGEVRPPTASAIPVSGNVGGTNYPYVLGTDSYRQLNFSMNSGIMMVTGRATFWIQDDLNISGTAKIVITPGASLTLYVGMPTGIGSIATITGGGIVNQNASALSFQYYGLPSNTSLTLSGNGTFVGSIYAPNADLTFNGGGAGGEDFSGAAIGKTVSMNGNFKFHYDEALRFIGPPKGYVVTKWDEMTAREVATGPTP
jgi:hypothetical protein